MVETDGAIEQGSALKSAYPGAPATGLHVARDRFDQALALPAFAARQLGVAGQAARCRACPVGRVCGGGHFAHRYRRGTGFANPSVYCPDLFRLITHIRSRMQADLRGAGGRRAGGAMRPVPYRLGEEELVALGGGDDVTKIVERLAAAQYDGRMLLLWGVIDTARRAGHPEAERVRHGYELLARLQRRYPGVAGEVLRHPAAGAWAFHTLRGLRGEPTGPAARPAGLAALAAAVLVKSGAEGAVEVPVVDGAVALPSLGQALLGTSDRFALVRSGAAGAEVIATGARWRYRPTRRRTRPDGVGCARSPPGPGSSRSASSSTTSTRSGCRAPW